MLIEYQIMMDNLTYMVNNLTWLTMKFDGLLCYINDDPRKAQ